MPRYFAQCAYEGTNYSGWQSQPNASTIQKTIEEAFSKVITLTNGVVGCGRTDAGVHASDYYFHFDTDQNLDDKLKYSLSSVVPRDIAIYRIIEVSDQAHARFDAMSRQYRYQIRTSYTPFQNSYYHTIRKGDLDLKKLNEIAAFISTLQDFEALSKKGSDVKNFDCEIMESHWKQEADEFIYTIKANRFLRGMVRLIVGMQLSYAMNKISMDKVKAVLRKEATDPLIYSVPATGLFLEKITYPRALGTRETES